MAMIVNFPSGVAFVKQVREAGPLQFCAVRFSCELHRAVQRRCRIRQQKPHVERVSGIASHYYWEDEMPDKLKPAISRRERFLMLDAAWQVAVALLYEVEDLRMVEARFLKRKCCQGLPERDCEAALHTAVGLARTTRRFYEKKCFDLPRTTARYYELLFSLAKLLERKFPSADPYLTMKGCRFVEMHWVL